MSGQRATITYTAPAAFLTTDHWKQVHAALLSQLPLRNLHWKSVSRPAIRTIQELPLNFVAADTVRDEHTSQIPQTLLERPLLSAYIVVCEDTETYKNTVRKQIKDWHTSTTQRKHQEWLIIHIVRPDTKSAGARIFQMKASVLDKIKADFNTDKRDRCVQLVWSSDQENPTAWADLIGKVKDGILSAFDMAVLQREDEVRRSEGQRQMPGWNFCTYFILKESLAFSFEGMSLYEDALDTYEELEELFFQVRREKTLTWFGSLISPSSKDDSAPLLSVTKKPYRELILANSISVFDFRVYLLARQCALWSKMSRVVEAGQKVVVFLGTFGRRLREMESELPPYFVESWTYSSALSVVEQCNAWAVGLEFNKATTANFNAVKGELEELARHQLDILGIAADFLPVQPPFSNSLPNEEKADGSKPKEQALDTISNLELRTALQDKDTFFELYVGLTNRAIELYASAGRRKFALRMHGSLAALDVVRGRLTNALQTYTSLPAHYAPHGWTSLEAFMLIRALDLHSSAEKPKDREWMVVLLEFLKAYVQDLGKALLITKEDHAAYVTSLINGLKDVAHSLQSDLTHLDHPGLAISISDSDAQLAETRDGVLLDIVVHNALPCDMPVDKISVVLSGREGVKLTFTEEVKSLPPGSSKLTVFCPSAPAGTYSLYSCQATLGRLNLQWLYIPQIPGKTHKPKRPPALVRIPKDLRALDVRLRQPQHIELGTPAKIVLVLSTGRNDVSKAMVRLSAPSGVKFQPELAELQENESGDTDTSFEEIDGAIVFFDIKADKTVQISVPHSDASAYHAMRVDIAVDYVTLPEPSITRSMKLARVVLTALPLAVNVEDFFRGTRLFTRFTLSTTSHQHVRIRSTDLRTTGQVESGVKIMKCKVQNHGIVTVTPAQPGRFLFQLDSNKRQGRDPLHLHITYRMLREEVESFINRAVKQALSEIPSAHVHQDVLAGKLVQALESEASWVELYGITGELIVPGLSSEDDVFDGALTRAMEVLEQGRRPEESDEDWRELVFPVDVPEMHILAAASLRILPNPFSTGSSTEKLPPLYAGQPIAATLTVTTSFGWAPAEDADHKSYVMRFDVEEMTKDWLVSGRKRGDFVAKDGQTFTTPLTLIALHHGELVLPKVGVSALPMSGVVRMGSMAVPSCETYQLHGAEKVLVLPRGGRTTFIVSMGDDDDNY
ncbi:hypothetical protein PHLCEN_2v4506 [Hermanssonia centrifuga]|uniref:Trafficking protein particle complex subunit 10 n=1 Tax=Hermanssonia centrifuga TaxID=98765 RepID=A0A2R6PNA1_9APHY|nr:hypothetical protein PHLCEN_2v4506 [Hermanssonia centrifuga]